MDLVHSGIEAASTRLAHLSLPCNAVVIVFLKVSLLVFGRQVPHETIYMCGQRVEQSKLTVGATLAGGILYDNQAHP